MHNVKDLEMLMMHNRVFCGEVRAAWAGGMGGENTGDGACFALPCRRRSRYWPALVPGPAVAGRVLKQP